MVRNTVSPARLCGPVLFLLVFALPVARGGQKVNRRTLAARHTAEASSLATAGKREEALRKLEEAFKYDAASIVAHRLYQDLMTAAGRRAEMLERYARARKKGRDRRLRNLLGYLEARAESDPKVRRGKLESVLKLNPRHFWEAHDLVAACTLGEDLAAAEKYGRAARDLRPRDADVRNVLGNVLLQAGKLKDAEKEFNEALKLRPSFAEALYNLGLIRSSQKKYAEAVEFFRKAGEAKETFAEAHNNRGHALARLGRLEEAIKAYQQATRIRPAYGQAWNNMSVAYYRSKDYWKAWECLQKAEKHNHAVNRVYKRVLRKRLFPERKPDESKKPAPAKEK